MFNHAKKSKKNSPITLDIDEAIKIQKRLEGITTGTHLVATDEDERIFRLASQIISNFITIYGMWNNSKKKVNRLLRMIFGNSSEKIRKTETSKQASERTATGAASGKTDTLAIPTKLDSPLPDKKEKRNGGGGKNSADDYESAVEIICSLDDEYRPGKICPECKINKLFQIDPQKVIRLVGKAPVTAFKFFLEKSRCICGAMFTAKVGEEFQYIYKGDKYSPSALASIIIHKYFMGVSFGMLDRVQKMSGVPVPASTQSNKIKELALPVLQAVGGSCKYLAANAGALAFDDTMIRVLEGRETTKGEKTNNGYGTAVIADKFDEEENVIIIFDFDFSKHAGDVICSLLSQRIRKDLPLLISDGLTAYDECRKRGVDVSCNVHARRNIFKEDPDKKTYVGYTILECYTEIYKNESYCREGKLSAIARMNYHREHSETYFERINTICLIILGKEVSEELRTKHSIPTSLTPEEPNSDLYIAAKYFVVRYQALTRVMTIPGVPLDTNHVERMIKLIIRLRKNSLFFNNTFSAGYSGDILSLLETADYCGVNVFTYVEHLIENKKAVMQNPQNYLPWLYTWDEDKKKDYWDRVTRLIQSPASFPESSIAECFHSSG